MKKLLIGLLALGSISSYASEDQSKANLIYRSIGIEIANSINSRNSALISLPNSPLVEETSRKMSYCETGRWGIVGVPFGVGRKNSCLNGYKKFALALEDVVASPAFDYLDSVVELPSKATSALTELSSLKIDKEHYCNNGRLRFLNDIKNSQYSYRISVKDISSGMRMDTIEAVRRLKRALTIDGSLVNYIENATSKEIAIRNGRELHLALRVLRMSVNNSMMLEATVLNGALRLQEGCEL